MHLVYQLSYFRVAEADFHMIILKNYQISPSHIDGHLNLTMFNMTKKTKLSEFHWQNWVFTPSFCKRQSKDPHKSVLEMFNSVSKHIIS